jgi:hypothetical protein
MADATPTAAVTDQVSSIDIESISIQPLSSQISYSLLVTWQSGRQERKVGSIKASDFNACKSAIFQAAPQRKFLTFLQANNYESNLSIT